MKFKVGDIVRHHSYPRQYAIITEIDDEFSDTYYYKVIMGRLIFLNNCYMAHGSLLIKATNKKIINKIHKLVIFNGI